MRPSRTFLLLALSATILRDAAHGHGDHGHGDHGHGDHDHGDHDHKHHCGVDTISHEEMARDQARMKRIQQTEAGRRQLQQLSCTEVCDGCIVIDTYFYFMGLAIAGGIPAHPPESVERLQDGDTTLTLDDFTTVEEMIDIARNNVAYTNSQLAGSPFRLNFIDTDVTVFTDERDYVYQPMSHRIAMTQTLGKGDLRVLDIYLSHQLLFDFEEDLENPPLRVGTASLPSQQLEQRSDGIFLRYDTLTGGGLSPFDDGVTLTHELGHWLGLYHTFETEDGSSSACEESPNDFILDTPAHLGESSPQDCQAMLTADDEIIEANLPDTCPALPGSDPVFNFMNYVRVDECHTRAGSFSCNQIERMYYQWILYRDEVSACPDGEFELEFTLTFDVNDHVADNQIVIYKNRGTPAEEIIFDTDNDHDPGAVGLNDVMAVDLCVPENAEYQFELTDASGDGFGSGTAQVSVFKDGVLLDSASDNFGSAFTVVIDAEGTATPTDVPTAGPTAAPAPGTAAPTSVPTAVPTVAPTSVPTAGPTSVPTAVPTAAPAPGTAAPTFVPTAGPTAAPAPGTATPTSVPTAGPTAAPAPGTATPTSVPTSGPTAAPAPGTTAPTSTPTRTPTDTPTTSAPTPTEPTTSQPTAAPTASPTSTPTRQPTTAAPTFAPTGTPTVNPTTMAPATSLPTRQPSVGTVLDIVINDPNLTFLERAIDALGLEDELSGPGPFVLLAPTDQAFQVFSALFPEIAVELFDPEWVAHLRELITFHASLEQFVLTTLPDGSYRFEMLAGEDIQVLVAAGVATITPTVATIPAEIMDADIAASNGLVSVIDSVLRPEFLSTEMVQLLQSSFPNFFALLVDTGLDDFIRNNFGLTIFAPDDSELANLNRRRLQTNRRGLYDILAAQIVEEVVPTEIMPEGFSSLASLAGTTLRIVRRGSVITVNGFPIRQADVLVSNGILHVVDQLFLASEVPAPTPPRPPVKGKGKGYWKGMGMWMAKPAPKWMNNGMGNWMNQRSMMATPMGNNMWMSKQRWRTSAYQKPQNVFTGMMWRQ